jgi:hypothetical protein
MSERSMHALCVRLAIAEGNVRALQAAERVVREDVRQRYRAEGDIVLDPLYRDVSIHLRSCEAERDLLRAAWESACYDQTERLIAALYHPQLEIRFHRWHPRPMMPRGRNPKEHDVDE